MAPGALGHGARQKRLPPHLHFPHARLLLLLCLHEGRGDTIVHRAEAAKRRITLRALLAHPAFNVHGADVHELRWRALERRVHEEVGGSEKGRRGGNNGAGKEDGARRTGDGGALAASPKLAIPDVETWRTCLHDEVIRRAAGTGVVGGGGARDVGDDTE
ncbi:hypothetical protein B0H14DRAFT_3476425 [Mycena olivaceomarginata]|nr:hypothetical protein B0H14DRAFT_3476425 [Mycena olivaceomarginata]